MTNYIIDYNLGGGSPYVDGQTVTYQGQTYTVYQITGSHPTIDVNVGDSFHIPGNDFGQGYSDNVDLNFQTADASADGYQVPITLDSTADGPGSIWFIDNGSQLQPDIQIEDGVNADQYDISLGGSQGGTVAVGTEGGSGALIHTIIGSDFGDTITINDNSSINGVVSGDGGNDTITVGDNVTFFQALNGGAGDDTITIGENFTITSPVNAYVAGGDGDDTIYVGDGFSSNFGGADIQGGAGSDTISVGSYGGTGSNNEYAVNGGANLNSTGTISDVDSITVRPPSSDFADNFQQDGIDQALAAGSLTQNADGSYSSTSYNSDTDVDFSDPNGVYYDLEDFSSYNVCFTGGTMIETDCGLVAIEDLAEGDLVLTRDHGLQPVRWIGSKKLSAAVLSEEKNRRPIRIRRHALGTNTPSSDLLVSPQHRVLVRSKIAQKMFDANEVLVAAKQLCQVDGIDIADDVDGVEYFHILFDRHEIVVSNGAETESLYTGPEALKSVGREALEEIFALFPELTERGYKPVSARALATGRMGRKLAVRHKQNCKALVAQQL